MQIRFSLGFKLGALLALILAAFTAAWWFVHHELGAIERLYSKVVTVHDPALDAAYKMHLGHVAIGVTVRDALAGMTADGPHRLDAARQEFERSLALFERVADDTNRRTLADLAQLHHSYMTHAERIMELGARRDTDLRALAALLTEFKRVLLEAVLPLEGPTTIDQTGAQDFRAAVNRLDETTRDFLIAPDNRRAWRVDEALKYFQRPLRRAALSGTARAATVRESADAIDRAVRAAVESGRALAASLPPFNEQARMIDYRLSSHFEPNVRRDMRQATAAALTRIRDADRRAALLLAAALLVGTVVCVVVMRNVLGPVRHLLRATRMVAAGHYRREVQVAGSDELAALGRAFNEMARTLEQTTVSRRLFDDILHALDEALFVTDDDGRIELANRAAYALTGAADGQLELVGRDIVTLLPDTPAATNDSQRAEQWLRTPAGDLAVLAARSMLHPRGDGVRRHVITALDITARRTAERALANSRDELQALHASLEQRLENERATLAHELHDELGASLTNMKTVVFLAAGGRRDISLALRELGEGIDSMSEATSRIVNGLRPPVLDHFGLIAALDWYVREFAARSGLHCIAELPAQDPEMPPSTALALFRAAQECLTNASRHARASEVRIALHVDRDRLLLRITDNGVGCVAGAVTDSQRFGLRGLRERLRGIGGSLQIETAPGHGLRALIVAPRQPDALAA